MGVNDPPLEFIKSYLTNRKYYVKLTETDAEGNVTFHKSEERVWNRGVPQGSNLGPYLFLVMINDLPSHLQSKLLSLFNEYFEFISSIYADDVNSIVSHKDFHILERICNMSIELMQQWCNNNRLKLNVKKTNFVHFKSAHNRFVNPPPILELNNTSIDNKDTCVFLGLRINEYLNWDKHIDYLCGRLRSGCFSLGRLRQELPRHTLKTVYYAHIYSHLRNNVIFWGHCSSATRVFILQKRSLRMIYGVPPTHSCVALFRDFGVLTLPCLYLFECAIFVKKNIHLFNKNSDTHSYNTRNHNQLSVFQHSKALFEGCPKYRLVHIYNKLPEQIRNIASISKFKKCLFNYLLDMNLYSIKSFV